MHLFFGLISILDERRHTWLFFFGLLLQVNVRRINLSRSVDRPLFLQFFKLLSSFNIFLFLDHVEKTVDLVVNGSDVIDLHIEASILSILTLSLGDKATTLVVISNFYFLVSLFASIVT